MTSIRPCPVPDGALLDRYVRSGSYTDCYVTEIPRGITHAEFVAAFYTTPVFKLERWLLDKLLSRPSTDSDARLLASGEADTFAAWLVEDRAPDQLLLAAGRIRSWLMATPCGEPGRVLTKLYFGSAVVPRRIESSTYRMGWTFTALLAFHKIYSRVLLRAARRRLVTAGSGGT